MNYYPSSYLKKLLALALCFSAFNALADTEFALSSESDFLAELPLILSATRLEQPLNEAPVGMTILDKELIEASGANNIAELMRMVPGFQMGYFDGNSPVTTYHGHSDQYSRRIQVLIDGRSVYVPSLAAVDWSSLAINIDDVEHIEVSRGPNAVTYGNNSFLAVINIFTKTAIEDQGHEIKSRIGSHDTANVFYRFGSQIDDIDYRVTVGTQNDEGSTLLNDYTHADYLSYRLDNQLNINQQLSYQGGFKDNKQGHHESPPDHQVEIQSAFQLIKWRQQTQKNNSLSVQYYYNYLNENRHNENNLIKLGATSDPATQAFLDPIDAFVTAPVNIKSQRHDIEVNYIQQINDLRLVSGGSARLDIVSAQNVFLSDDTQRHQLYRLHSNAEYRFNSDWIMNTGLMIESNDISGQDIAPRIALIHHLNKHNSLRFSASRATRTPTLYDQNAYNVLHQKLTDNGGTVLDPAFQALLGNTDVLHDVSLTSVTDVDSEEITSLEIGFVSYLLNNKLLLDMKIAKDETDKLIGLTTKLPVAEDNAPADGVSADVQNTHQTEIKSFELSVDYKPSKDFRIYGHYAYIDIEAFMYNPLGKIANTDRLRVSAPENSYHVTLIKHWPNKLNSSLIFNRVDTYDWLDRTRNRGTEFWKSRNVFAYSKVDVKIDKTYSFGNESMNVSLIIQNLADDFFDYNRTHYADASLTLTEPVVGSIDQNGSLQDRRAYLELSYRFN